MTTQFYVPPDHIHGDRITLPDDEAAHASKVLRSRPGDELVAVDGEGGWYRFTLDHVDRGSASGHVVERRRDVGEPRYHLTIVPALMKNAGRFETFLEKAVELGVKEIVPIVTERTERDRLRVDRSVRILIAAMKQCGRSRLTTLRAPMSLGDVSGSAGNAVDLCCHESAARNDHILNVLRDYERPGLIRVFVGPEGGFTDDEIEELRDAGSRIVSLGRRRLRAETAAITAAAAVSLVYDSA